MAAQLRRSARDVTEPQRSRILELYPKTLFISHSSVDDAFIKVIEGEDVGRSGPIGRPGSIWWICDEAFVGELFYHSLKTGGAESYVRIVGLALLASTRVLVVWSENALRSDFVRAEILVAIESNKKVAVYAAPEAPTFPIAGVEVIHDCEALRTLMQSWHDA
jgi:hypothetical protein